MAVALWFVIGGTLFTVMALSATVLKRLPLTSSMLYLGAGIGLGQAGLGLLQLDPIEEAKLLEHATEIAVSISLFTAGLKLRTPLLDGRWRLPLRLATITMVLTVGLIALAGVVGLGLSIGAAILLGGILAPTDPVLASDVQVEDASDRDRLRFGLTGEAGMNDGTALPFVVLGLGLLGLHELGTAGWSWLLVDVGWSIAGGIVVGGVLGTLAGRLVIYLRREHKEAVGLDDFLALGLLGLAYGLALLVDADGFVSVFAAGVALRRVEHQATGDRAPEDVKAMATVGQNEEEIATDAEKAPAYMAEAVLGFNEQLERIGEVAIVVLIGALLGTRYLAPEAIWFVPLLFLAIRPISVGLGLIGSRTLPSQRWLMSWFGVRGIGSLFYLTYALERGVEPELAQRLTALTLTVIAASIVVHGISVTPLMRLYARGNPEEAGEHA